MPSATDAQVWPKAGMSFVIKWMLLIELVQQVADAAVGAVLQLPADAMLSNPAILAFGLLLRGTSTGIAQSIVLRPWHLKPRGWILATAIGWMFGGLLAFAAVTLLGFSFGPYMFGLLPAAMAGAALAQSFPLRRAINHSGWWVVANAAAGLLPTIALFVDYTLSSLLVPHIVWIATGVTLTGLLGCPAPQVVSPEASPS